MQTGSGQRIIRAFVLLRSSPEVIRQALLRVTLLRCTETARARVLQQMQAQTQAKILSVAQRDGPEDYVPGSRTEMRKGLLEPSPPSNSNEIPERAVTTALEEVPARQQ